MTLHALLNATETIEGGEELRATGRIAGQTLIERQADLCREAGVDQVFVAVGRMTYALTQAFDRLRAAGITIEPVRSAREIRDRTSDHDGLLLVLDGLHAGVQHIRAFAAGPRPAILVTPDSPVTRGLELIDAECRWAGLASVPCGVFEELAGLPEEWDLASTVLRRAVQMEATKIPCDAALFERGDLCVLDRATAYETLSVRVFAQTRVAEPGLFTNLVHSPLSRLVGPAILRRDVAPSRLWAGGLILSVATAAALLAFPLSVFGLAFACLLGLVANQAFSLSAYVRSFVIEPPLHRFLSVAGTVSGPLCFALLGAAIAVRSPLSWPLAEMAVLIGLQLLMSRMLSRSAFSRIEPARLPDASLGFACVGVFSMLGFPGGGIGVAIVVVTVALIAAVARLENPAPARVSAPERGGTVGFKPN